MFAVLQLTAIWDKASVLNKTFWSLIPQMDSAVPGPKAMFLLLL